MLAPSSVVGHEALNLAAFEDFVLSVEGGADLILNKIQGVAHGGGIQVSAGSADFANVKRFLRLLGCEITSSALTPDTLFDGVTMVSPARTLRRAALIFAGRMPTVHEINAVSGGSTESLRQTIRGLMIGPGFHEFLIRAANDRLLTDRFLEGQVLDAFDVQFTDFVNLHWDMWHASRRRGYEFAWEDPVYSKWYDVVQRAAARAPLELSARIAENDLPYTEILTADYIMANPLSARAYGLSTKFDAPNDYEEFSPSKIEAYYGRNDSMVTEGRQNCCERVVNPGTLHVDYPHAGMLNTKAFSGTRQPRPTEIGLDLGGRTATSLEST